ncbi:hypothetical protein N9545_10010 [Salibacteraceae bacterium]|nr:hypothetical protein [Salibacteraceae bacterium]MDB4105847.1 hypothetical protein [Salibacteraceae bacterium]MDB9710271.1 hypothetical protein [Salibacteraceae bacterium]MDC1305151.1 hypothetical protein [Salibacteraceae bacterium]
MHLTTIIGLSESVKDSEYYQSKKRSSDKAILLDKCNWFVSRIIALVFSEKIDDKESKHKWRNIPSITLKRYLGASHYKDILGLLRELDYIEVNGSYSTTRFTKSFRLTQKAFSKGMTYYTIDSNSFKKTLETQAKRRAEVINSNPIFKKLYDNLLKIKSFKENFFSMAPTWSSGKVKYIEVDGMLIDQIDDRWTDTLRYESYFLYYSNLQRLVDIDNLVDLNSLQVCYSPKIVDTGRVYYPMVNVPRLVREYLITKDERPLYEVDMTSAQPSILFLEYLNSKVNYQAEGPQFISGETKLILGLLLRGEVYKYIQTNSSFFGEMKYDALKKAVLTTLNDKSKPNNPNNIHLKRLFPGFMSWVNDIKKKHGYKRVSFIGQSTEAKIFVHVYRSIPSNFLSLLIHDCVITTEEGVEPIKSLLIKRVKELYPLILGADLDLDKLFKTKRITIEHQNRESVRYLKFTEEMIEDLKDLL